MSNVNRQQPEHRWTVRVAWAALVLFALAIGLPGLRSLPIDKHEALLIQTSNEMLARGEWIVPWFNEAPRLNKPPLAYWTAMATHWLRTAGTPSRVEIIDARIPALLSMWLIAGLAAWLAGREGGWRTAWLAAAFVIVSPMMAFTSHDGRPDALYALLVFAGGASMASVLLDTAAGRTDGRDRLKAYGAWLLWGLATLTKGPHVPLMLAVGLWLYAARTMGWRAAARRMRPVSGVLLIGVVAWPWWWLLEQRLGETVVAHSQLGGSLYRPGFAALGKAYREVLGVGLLFPWFLLIPLYWRETRGLLERSAVARLCAYAYLVPLLLFLLAPQHRWHYMQPVTGFLAVFLALLAGHLLARKSWLRIFGRAIWILLGAILTVNALTQWFWDDRRFQRQRYMSPLSAPGVADVPVAATPGIESGFEVAVAHSRHRVSQLEDASAWSEWHARLGPECGMVLIYAAEAADWGVDTHSTVLAEWPEFDKTIQARLVGHACTTVAESYRAALDRPTAH
ncbi:MAG: hypothetical protein Kow0020_06410 [Wenzhouxiangellaceae bacterium]